MAIPTKSQGNASPPETQRTNVGLELVARLWIRYSINMLPLPPIPYPIIRQRLRALEIWT